MVASLPNRQSVVGVARGLPIKPATLQRQSQSTGVCFAPVPPTRVPSGASPLWRQGVVFAPVPNSGTNPSVGWNSSRSPAILQRNTQPAGVRPASAPQAISGFNIRVNSGLGVVFAPVPQLNPSSTAEVIRKELPPNTPLPVTRQRRPIQRYTAVPEKTANKMYGVKYDLRVSDDGKMAVRDTLSQTPRGTEDYQLLYLAQDVLEASQRALGWVNSGVALIGTGKSVTARTSQNGHAHTLRQVTIFFSDFPINASYTSCNANMFNVMGATRELKEQKKVYGLFKPSLGNGLGPVDITRDTAGASNAVRSHLTGEPSGKRAQNAWESLDDTHRDSEASRYGFNQYAEPNAGEGIGIFKAGSTGVQAAGHFAGVIARSGGDYITLENFAGNPGSKPLTGANASINPNWFVRMFGSNQGQSFFDFHQTYEKAEYGEKPIAIRFGEI